MDAMLPWLAPFVMARHAAEHDQGEDRDIALYILTAPVTKFPILSGPKALMVTMLEQLLARLKSGDTPEKGGA